MDLAVILFLSFSSICIILLAFYSIYYVLLDRESKRFHYKIAFPSLLSLILTMVIRRLILEIHGRTLTNFHTYLIVYIENLVSCIAAILIILSAVALGLPIWTSLMKNFLMIGSNGSGILSLMVRFAETKGQTAIYILMSLATVIFLSSAALLPRIFLAIILLMYSFMVIIPIITIPLLPTTYYLLALLVKSRKESNVSKSKISQARGEAAKLFLFCVAIMAINVIFFPTYGMIYLDKPFEDKSDIWYSQSDYNPSELFSIEFDWSLTASGFLACFIFRDLALTWLKQFRPMPNTATMGSRTRNFLSIATQGKDSTLSSGVLKA